MEENQAKTGVDTTSDNRVALVTGGAVRVGRALSLGLAKQGFDVIAHFHSSDAQARSLEAEINNLGRRCLTVRANLGTVEGVSELAAATSDRYEQLDLLINSASIFHEQPLFEASPEEWDAVMAINLRAPFLLTQAMAPLLKTAAGSVINIVDVSAFQPWLRYPHHSVSKAGLLHLTRIMAREMAPEVRVNAIAPGTVLPPDGSSDAEIERERAKTLVGRLGTPEDVVEAALFLARSNFISGEVLVVDGGLRWS